MILPSIERKLQTQTFLALGNELTLADIAMYNEVVSLFALAKIAGGITVDCP